MASSAKSARNPPTICIIGAGFSGLTAGLQLKLKLGLSSFTIYDENAEVGGCWFRNTYPGCVCDVPSLVYSFSFAPNPNWSSLFPSREEIWNYLKETAAKHNLYAHIAFNTQVKSLTWNEVTQKWRAVILDKETGKDHLSNFDIVISGTGIFRRPNLPKEFEAFRGPTVHSAQWDADLDLTGKVVGIVGSGASAVQIIPSIASRVRELHCYQRQAAWVKPKDQTQFQGLSKWVMSQVPFAMWLYRTLMFLLTEWTYFGFVDKSYTSRTGTIQLQKRIKDEVPDKLLQEKLMPTYPHGCNRITFSNDYYPALCLPQVKVNTGKIVGVTEDSILTSDGGRQKIDVLILATGFKNHDYFEPMEITGTGSTDILASWKAQGPQLYLGITGSQMPNHFVLLGPNTVIVHNSVLFMIECQVDFVLQLIEEMMSREAKAVSVKPAAEQAYMKALGNQMPKMVWANAKCGSWFSDARGRITALWPWGCFRYWWKTRKVDFDQFEFTS